MTSLTIDRIYLYVKFLAVLGIILAVYLLWQQNFRPAFQLCTINETVNCDAIISGEVAKTFGISTPLIGLVGYVVILLSAVLKKKTLLLGMTCFGLVFCLWIAYKELFELGVICPVCIMCQVLMILVFTLAVMLRKKA